MRRTSSSVSAKVVLYTVYAVDFKLLKSCDSVIKTPLVPTSAMAAASAQAPPIAHAIGGSLGSALALLLFYPLERARIQLQAEASRPKEHPVPLSFEPEVDLPNKPIEQELEPNYGSDSSWLTLPKEEEGNSLANISKLDDGSAPSATGSSSDSPSPCLSPTIKKKETLLQCLVELYEKGQLYTGVSPVVSTILTSQFIFFYMHAVVKTLLRKSIRGSERSSAALSLLSSCLAGLGNVILTNPLWVVNMAIVTGETKTGSLWGELYTMIRERGLKPMWDGTSASVLLVSNPVIQFFCYEQMKAARMVLPKKTVLPPMEAFFLGAMAKGVATITT
eukprot:scaffold1669_cov129-Cylindrotheca_fusiformis.AAC.23